MSDLVWVAAGCEAGAWTAPPDLSWLPSGMPATAASVLTAAGLAVEDLDERDWWWRTTLPADLPAGSFLVGGGIATLAEIWIDARLVHRVHGMFEEFTVPAAAGSTVSIRVRSLTTALTEKRTRPRWKARLVAEQRLRWFRTSMTGRMPGFLDGHPPVGPWRGIRLVRGDVPSVVSPGIVSELLTDGRGLVTVRSLIAGLPEAAVVFLEVGGQRVPATVAVEEAGLAIVTGAVSVDEPALWWPHTHGFPSLVPVTLEADGIAVPLGSTGFRHVVADRSADGFGLDINGCHVFARGACWSPLSDDGTQVSLEEATGSLARLAGAGLNMVRFPGTTAWAFPELLAVCDRLGILVWQDVPMAAMDQPDSAEFTEQLFAEVASALAAASASPSLVVICGGAEIEQQAAMIGLSADIDAVPLSTGLAAVVPPELIYVANSPTGGLPAFRVDTGVAQYFGVGAYRRPLEDARRAAVRFAAECFAFAVPPADRTAADLTAAQWAAGIPRDRGADWDFGDVSEHYSREVFGRLDGASTALTRDLHSAAAAECLTALLAEWRRPGSPCAGALAISLRDVVAGPGWGLLDAAGRPKSTWFAARRASAPIALLHTDEGLNGLALHVVNDRAEPFVGSLELSLYAGERLVETGSVSLDVPARGGITVGDVEILGVFRDVTQSYHFGPSSFEVAAGTLLDAVGHEVARTVYLPTRGALERRDDVGLRADLIDQTVTVTADRHARGVVVSVDDGDVEDAWFDLLPGETRTLRVTGGRPTVTQVRAVNAIG